jgi:hypothetical protein
MKQIPLLATAAVVVLSVGGGVSFSARGADDEATPVFGIKLPPDRASPVAAARV